MMDDLYPVKVYEYLPNGYHTGGVTMNELEFKAWMQLNFRRILAQKLELRVTDMGDRMVFHCADGLILYDGENRYDRRKKERP